MLSFHQSQPVFVPWRPIPSLHGLLVKAALAVGQTDMAPICSVLCFLLYTWFDRRFGICLKWAFAPPPCGSYSRPSQIAPCFAIQSVICQSRKMWGWTCFSGSDRLTLRSTPNLTTSLKDWRQLKTTGLSAEILRKRRVEALSPTSWNCRFHFVFNEKKTRENLTP